MKVMVLGIRGLPNVQGGVETHAEQLYERLAGMGCKVDVIVRTPFVPKEQSSFRSIRLRRIWAPRRPGLEAFLHSVLGAMYAGIARPDILHIHAIGPAIVTPLARLFGLRVIVTHHGPDYNRDKWGWFARWILRIGERAGMRWSHGRIAISKVIAELIRSRYGKDADIIPNGVAPAKRTEQYESLLPHGLEPGRFVLQVSRMVPEKRQLDLIQAFTAAALSGWKLALVGGLTDDHYSEAVRAAATENVVLTGFLKGAALQQIYSHAGLFVLPSSHEGLPIAMLEALSYGLRVLASDIPANKEVGLDCKYYFPVGNVQALTERLMQLTQETDFEGGIAARQEWVAKTYDWERIAELTMAVYLRSSKQTINK